VAASRIPQLLNALAFGLTYLTVQATYEDFQLTAKSNLLKVKPTNEHGVVQRQSWALD
jgi:hypothetical protein